MAIHPATCFVGSLSLYRIVFKGCCGSRRVLRQNQKYYQRFPDDVEAVQKIVRHLIMQPGGGVRTPSGNLLTPRSLQLLGLSGAHSAARITYLVKVYQWACRLTVYAAVMTRRQWEAAIGAYSTSTSSSFLGRLGSP